MTLVDPAPTGNPTNKTSWKVPNAHYIPPACIGGIVGSIEFALEFVFGPQGFLDTNMLL